MCGISTATASLSTNSGHVLVVPRGESLDSATYSDDLVLSTSGVGDEVLGSVETEIDHDSSSN